MDFRKNRQQLMKNCAELLDIAMQLDLKYVTSKLEMFLHILRDDNFFITVVGEFNRGKSTMVNALIGDDILPTSIRPTTATLNFIHASNERFIHVHYADGHKSKVPWNKNELKNFTALRDVNAKDINYIELGCPLNGIAEDIVIVDTPGVNDVSEQRMDVTYKYIPMSDVVVFILSAIQSITQSEISFLRDFVMKDALRRFFFLMNYKDMACEEEIKQAVACVREQLEQFLPGESIHIIPISAKQALYAKRDGDNDLLTLSGFAHWEDLLYELSNSERQQLKMERFQQKYNDLKKMFFSALATAKEQENLSGKEMDQVIETLEESKTASQKQFDDLCERLSEMTKCWHHNVHISLERSQEDFLQEQLLIIEQDMQTQDFTKYAEQTLPFVIQRHWKMWLEYQQGQFIAAVNKDLQTIADEYCRRFEARELFFELSKQAVVDERGSREIHIEGGADIHHIRDYGGYTGAIVIGASAMLSGAALFAVPLIAFSGNNLGSYLAQKFFINDKTLEQKRQLKHELQGVIEEQSKRIEDAINIEFKKVANNMRRCLSDDFKLVWQELEAELLGCQRQRMMSETASQSRIQELVECQERIGVLITEGHEVVPL